MESSPVLRLQSQKKICSDFLRIQNENNKIPAQQKTSKLQSSLQHTDQNIENQDPCNSQTGKKAPVRQGISRLPVLAKSLHLQTPSDFSQSHCRWEEKPLSGKAKTKRPCTRPIPFNLSQPKSSRVASENQQPLTLSQTRTAPPTVQTVNNARNGQLRMQNIHSKPTKQTTFKRNMDSSKCTEKSYGNPTENTPQLCGKSVPSNTFKTSATSSRPLLSASNKGLLQNQGATISALSALTTEACMDNMNLLSLKDSSESHQSKNMPLSSQGNVSKGSTDKDENFQPNHAALLSILQNEGVSATSLCSPQSKPYNYVPQRVSIMKSRQKAGPLSASVKSAYFSPDPAALLSILQNEGVKAGGPVGATPRNSVRPSGRGTSVYTAQRVPVKKDHTEAAGGPATSVKSAYFSPDPAALQTILQNEGVKAGGPVDATPRNSVRPSGRGTSIYTAQRVPVKKNLTEAAGGPATVSIKDTQLKKWTPQRVLDTRHQPMSAMKWHLSTQKSPYASSPGLRSFKTNLQPQQEEVVQRLFEDQEDQQDTNDPERQTEQLPCEVKTLKSEVKMTSHCEEKEDENYDEVKDERIVAGQPFIQAPQRESVIFFSTGKKLLRAARFEKQECSADHDQHGLISLVQTMLPVHEEKTSVSEPTCQTNPAVHNSHRDLGGQKTCSKSPALVMLRKRLPQLEELRMDEEVATYTSVSVQAVPGFLPPRPRCGNPLASILHFEEFSRFVPINCGLSSSPSSPQSSPLQER